MLASLLTVRYAATLYLHATAPTEDGDGGDTCAHSHIVHLACDLFGGSVSPHKTGPGLSYVAPNGSTRITRMLSAVTRDC